MPPKIPVNFLVGNRSMDPSRSVVGWVGFYKATSTYPQVLSGEGGIYETTSTHSYYPVLLGTFCGDRAAYRWGEEREMGSSSGQPIMGFLDLLWRDWKAILVYVKLQPIQILEWLNKQESPPAWMQEAYCPPRSKYTLCCSSWGYPRPPPPSWPGTWVGGGTPILTWDVPNPPPPSPSRCRLTNWKQYLSSSFGFGR